MYIYINVYVHIHIHACTYTHTYTYTHIRISAGGTRTPACQHEQKTMGKKRGKKKVRGAARWGCPGARTPVCVCVPTSRSVFARKKKKKKSGVMH